MNPMGKEKFNFHSNLIKLSMMDNGIMGKCKDEVFLNGQMVLNMMVNLLKAKNKVLVNLSLLMGTTMKDIG